MTLMDGISSDGETKEIYSYEVNQFAYIRTGFTFWSHFLRSTKGAMSFPHHKQQF